MRIGDSIAYRCKSQILTGGRLSRHTPWQSEWRTRASTESLRRAFKPEATAHMRNKRQPAALPEWAHRQLPPVASKGLLQQILPLRLAACRSMPEEISELVSGPRSELVLLRRPSEPVPRAVTRSFRAGEALPL